MNLRLAAALAASSCLLATAAQMPARAGSATAQMTVSVTVVAPRPPGTPVPAAAARADRAEAPIAVVTDEARRTRLVIY